MNATKHTRKQWHVVRQDGMPVSRPFDRYGSAVFVKNCLKDIGTGHKYRVEKVTP